VNVGGICRFWAVNRTKNAFGDRTRWGSYSAPPVPPSRYKGEEREGRGGKVANREEMKGGREGREGIGRDGKGKGLIESVRT